MDFPSTPTLVAQDQCHTWVWCVLKLYITSSVYLRNYIYKYILTYIIIQKPFMDPDYVLENTIFVT